MGAQCSHCSVRAAAQKTCTQSCAQKLQRHRAGGRSRIQARSLVAPLAPSVPLPCSSYTYAHSQSLRFGANRDLRPPPACALLPCPETVSICFFKAAAGVTANCYARGFPKAAAAFPAASCFCTAWAADAATTSEAAFAAAAACAAALAAFW